MHLSKTILGAGLAASLIIGLAGESGRSLFQSRRTETAPSPARTASAGISGGKPAAAAALTPALATQWWVSASAPAGGNGSFSQPYQTIDAAMAVAVSGDTMTVRQGTYREAATLFVKAGVTLQANAGDQVIVTGMGDLSTLPWAPFTGSSAVSPGTAVYSATASWRVRNMYNSYVRCPLSRTPSLAAAPIPITAVSVNNGVYTLTVPSLGVTFDNPRSSFVYVYEKKTLGLYLSYYITGITDDGTTATITLTGTDSYAPYMVAGDTLTVCNHPALLRGGSDWAYQDNNNGTTTLFWAPVSSTDLGAVQTNKTNYVIRLSNLAANTTVEGLEVTGATANGIYGNGCSGAVTIKNCLVHDNGEGGQFGAAGLNIDSCRNAVIQNCIVSCNYVGIASVSCNGFTLQQTEVGYNDSDGVDVAGRADANGVPIAAQGNYNVLIDRNYFHNHVSLLHPDNLQFYGGVHNVTISNNFLAVSGQTIMSENLDQVVATNNVFMASGAYSVILGHGNSTNWSLNNNTFAFGFYGATTGNAGTTISYTLLDSLFYRSGLPFTDENSSDYNLFWNATDAICNTSPPFTNYYANPTGSQKGLPALRASFPQYEAHSSAGNPLFMNAPITSAQVLSGISASTPSQLLLDAQSYCTLTGYFNPGDVVEVDGDGVARTITAVTNTSSTRKTITIDPPLNARPFRFLQVWDWPPGTTNLVLDLRPGPGSPALTGSSTGGPRGSTINTAQFTGGSFDGSGSRSIPPLPGTMQHVYATGGYTGFPYFGIYLSPTATAPSIAGGLPPATAQVGSPYTFTFQTLGFPMPVFSVTSGALPPGLGLSASGMITGTPTAAGTYSGVVTASNGIGAGATQSFSIVVPVSGYSAWASQEGLSGNNVSQTAILAPDGLTNLLKYALGLHAFTTYNPSGTALPAVRVTTYAGASYLSLTFTGNAADVTYTVQGTSDLMGGWPAVKTYPKGSPPGTVVVQDSQAVSASPVRFMRLQVAP